MVCVENKVITVRFEVEIGVVSFLSKQSSSTAESKRIVEP